MPLSPLGTFHTLVGGGAVACAVYMLWRYKQIRIDIALGKFYLLGTLLTAVSALGIFKHGGPNAAHVLAVLTIAAVVIGYLAAMTSFLGAFKKYFVALCFSTTVLFHLIPTATEILTRFPMDNPMVTSLEDPLLFRTWLVILIVFLILLAMQMNWLRKQA